MMARGSVKLSIYSTFKDDGVKKAEKAVDSFVKKYGELDKATGKKTVDDATRALVEQSVQLDLAAARWRGYSETLEAAGTALTKYVSAPAAAVAAATTKLASDFEDGFAKVKTKAATEGVETCSVKDFAMVDVLVTTKPHGATDALAVLALRQGTLQPLVGIALITTHYKLHTYYEK